MTAAVLEFPKLSEIDRQFISLERQRDVIRAQYKSIMEPKKMSSWDTMFEWIIKHEGTTFVNHKDDPGGATMLGVTIKTWSDWIGREATIDEMKALTKDDVKPLYKKWYHEKVHAQDLPVGVDWCVVDIGVNSGPSRAKKMLQKCVGVKQDGAVGPMTLAAVAALDPEEIVERLHDERARFYRSLNKEMFIKGWLRRNKEVKEQALGLME